MTTEPVPDAPGDLRAAPLFAWDWPPFVVTALCAVPAVLVATFGDTHLGLAMVISLAAPAFAGVAPLRRRRRGVLAIGALLPASLLVGTLLREYTGVWIAALALALLAFGAAMWLSSPRGRPVGMAFIVPVAAIGLSYDDPQTPLLLLVLMVAVSVLALAIALLFPERPVPTARPSHPMPRPEARRFGTYFGLTVAVATVVGYPLDHTGWVAGSAALVTRPAAEMQRFRSLWRVGSILVGATAVSLFMLARPTPFVAAGVAAALMTVLAGLQTRSRAYFAPAVLTFATFLLIEYPIASDGSPWGRFAERVLWVSVGVAIAYVVALALPRAVDRLR